MLQHVPDRQAVQHTEQQIVYAIYFTVPVLHFVSTGDEPTPFRAAQRGAVPMFILYGGFSVRLAVGTAQCLATHRFTEFFR